MKTNKMKTNKTKRRKPNYIYEIGIPVSEYWIYNVEGTSFRDAMNNIRNNHDSAEQICSDAAPIGRTKPKVYKRILIK